MTSCPCHARRPADEAPGARRCHLYQFLLATTHLETRIVNRAAELIATNRAGVLDVPGVDEQFAAYGLLAQRHGR